jgi:hypothetical protein
MVIATADNEKQAYKEVRQVLRRLLDAMLTEP